MNRDDDEEEGGITGWVRRWLKVPYIQMSNRLRICSWAFGRPGQVLKNPCSTEAATTFLHFWKDTFLQPVQKGCESLAVLERLGQAVGKAGELSDDDTLLHLGKSSSFHLQMKSATCIPCPRLL
jgi:hypothetical protein